MEGTHLMPVLVRRFPNRDALTEAASASLAAVIAAIHTGGGLHGDGIARIVVTGGSAGEELLEKLAQHQPGGGKTPHPDWSRVRIYFGDERNVAVSDPESNEGAARRRFLDRLAGPSPEVYGWGLDGGDMDAAAAAYEKILAATAPKGFDVHLLGMGHEGHINSLFPHHPATNSDRLVETVHDSPKPPAERTTLTLKAVRTAQRVWLIVAGEEKADAVAALLAGSDEKDLPAAGAVGTMDTILWADESALGN